MSTGASHGGKPNKSRIRRRSVRFGNPSLFTYHGCLYTIEGDSDEEEDGSAAAAPRGNSGAANAASKRSTVRGSPSSSLRSRPLVEGAEQAERLAAMVRVPPEQVPEGVLNLVRSHRPWIHHVRIVIEDPDDESNDVSGSNDSQPASAKAGEFHEHEIAGDGSFLISPTAMAVESAASILAAEHHRQVTGSAVAEEEQQMHHATSQSTLGARTERDGRRPSGSTDELPAVPSPSPSRTYLVLFEMRDEEAAEQLVGLLHGQPFTCLDESQVCSLYHVAAIHGDDGVSLMSPFFASTAAKTAEKAAPSSGSSHAATGLGMERVPNSSSQLSGRPREGPNDVNAGGGVSGGRPAPGPSPSSSGNGASASTEDSVAGTSRHRLPSVAATDDYNCAVCLERLDWDHLGPATSGSGGGERNSILTTVCNHSFHLDCLMQWQDSPCPVCRYDHSGLNEALSRCHVCGTTEHNFVCLICGTVSCGGGSGASASGGVMQPGNGSGGATQPIASHARQHYDEHLHAYALDTETQHVWDFAGGGYVHRLLQNKSDGKLVEVNDPSNTTSRERTLAPGLSDAQEGEVVHRKLEGFASQYYTLLKSQLEQQRVYYEGRLEEIRREHAKADRPRKVTSDLISALKHERHQLSQRLATLTSRRDKVREDVSFLKSLNENLEENKDAFRDQLKEAQRNRVDMRLVFESMLPPLQQKVTALMLQLEGSDSDTKPPAT